jgi:hypothetical protein
MTPIRVESISFHKRQSYNIRNYAGRYLEVCECLNLNLLN